MVLQWPTSSADFADARWEDIAPYYQALLEQPLEGDVEAWLHRWSTLDELVTEAAALAMIAYTADTTDAAKEAAHLRFSAEILPRAEEQSVALAKKLVERGYVRPGLETVLRRFRTQIELFREENVPLFAELEALSSQYQRITGGMTAEWGGKRVPVPQLNPHLKSPDRAVRERAFRAIAAPYVAERETLADVFDRMYALRQQVAANAGFASFRDYVFPARFRFDYTPADCERFHDAVEATVVPALERLNAHRREALGLARLRPWDLTVSVHRREPLRPFSTAAELSARAARIFERIDPAFGREFRLLLAENLLDLESRPGKAPGGYCETLHHRGRPFIFMNAVGVDDDVMTLLHEAGHAFHAFAAHSQPLIWQRHPGSEACELASMSMELLSAPLLGAPGSFYSEADAVVAQLEHLEDILVTLAHVASVDAFQHWIYTSGEGHDRDARDAAWLRLRERFDRGADWTGLEAERVARWYRQLHIFLYPFYYIEYGIAQLGALQVWWNSLRDHASAVARYREALALGATRPLPDIFAAAGARLVFDETGMRELVSLVEDRIVMLRARRAA